MARYAALTEDPVRLGLAAATVALIAIASVGLITLPSKGRAVVKDTAKTTLPARQVDGRVLQRFADAGFLGVVVDAQDRALLHVVVAKGTEIVDCNVINPVPRVVSQRGDDVRIVVSGYQYVPKATAENGLGGTTCIGAGSISLPLRLAAPLGQRRLYEGSSSSATTVADPADFPAVTARPAGYTAGAARPVNPATGNLVASRTYAKGADRLVLRIGSRFTVTAPGAVEVAGNVAGQYATVSTAAGQRCITWTELSGRVRQVCSVARVPLGASVLIAVARSLR